MKEPISFGLEDNSDLVIYPALGVDQRAAIVDTTLLQLQTKSPVSTVLSK